jgi:hypothetical protein
LFGRKISVQLVVDASAAERGFAKTSHAARKFDKDLQHSVRGVISGSGAFEHLGRSLAFASGGFLAAKGITDVLTESIDAAREAGVTQKSLSAQLKVAGTSFGQWKDKIEAADLSLARFGFNSDDAEQSMITLVRATGNAGKALSLQGVVANIARAKNIALAKAALIVGKALSGQTTALRRAVPGLSATAKGMDLVRAAGAKLHGQAGANTTVVQRFNATLHDSEVIIGNGLLPTVNAYLGKLTAWLQKMNRTGRLQRDVNGAVRVAAGLFSTLKSIVVPLAHAFQTLARGVGGTANALKLLIGLAVASKLSGLSLSIARIGTSAATSAGEVEGLSTKLGLLARLNPIGVIASLGIADVVLGKKAFTTEEAGGAFVAGSAKSPYQKGTENDDIFHAGLHNNRGRIRTSTGVLHYSDLTTPEKAAFAAGLHIYDARKAAAHAASASAGPSRLDIPGAHGKTFLNGALTAQQKLQLALAAHPDSVSLLQQQAAHDRAAIAFAGRLRASGRKSNAEYFAMVMSYQNDLTSTLQRITQITTSSAKKVSAARGAALKGLLSKAGDASGSFSIAGTALFRALHPLKIKDAHGSFQLLKAHYAPSRFELADAKANALNDQGAIYRLAVQERAAAYKALKSHRLSVQAMIDAWNVIGQANQTLGSDIHHYATAASSRLLTSGLGLRKSTRKALESRLALAGAFSGHVPTTMGVLGQSSVIVGQVHVHGVQDAHQLADRLGKLGRSKPVQTVGPNAGRSRALP